MHLKWHTGVPHTHFATHVQATNIFFENARLFTRDFEHKPYCSCNCMWWTKFCRFLHEHKGNIMLSVFTFKFVFVNCAGVKHYVHPMFARTMVRRIFTENSLNIMYILCLQEPWFVVYSQKINLLWAGDAPSVERPLPEDGCRWRGEWREFSVH